jgi:hypothetical protein
MIRIFRKIVQFDKIYEKQDKMTFFWLPIFGTSTFDVWRQNDFLLATVLIFCTGTFDVWLPLDNVLLPV